MGKFIDLFVLSIAYYLENMCLRRHNED